MIRVCKDDNGKMIYKALMMEMIIMMRIKMALKRLR